MMPPEKVIGRIRIAECPHCATYTFQRATHIGGVCWKCCRTLVPYEKIGEVFGDTDK